MSHRGLYVSSQPIPTSTKATRSSVRAPPSTMSPHLRVLPLVLLRRVRLLLGQHGPAGLRQVGGARAALDHVQGVVEVVALVDGDAAGDVGRVAEVGEAAVWRGGVWM